MKALISGQAGIAVLIDSEEYASMEVHSLDPVPRADYDVDRLLGDASDLLLLEGVSKEEAAHELEIAWRKDRSLHLALIVLDGEADRENRESAAMCLADLLQDSSVTKFLENRFYASPLPALADLPGALKLAESSASANFANVLRAVRADQELIQRTREAWDAMRPDLFGGPVEKERFGFAAVQSGAFRLLARDNPDEALSRFLEFTKNHRTDAKWDVRRLLKRWQKLSSLVSSERLASDLVETRVSRGSGAWARILAMGDLVSRRNLSAMAATCLVAMAIFVSFYQVPVSAKDSLALTPPGTAGIKATSSLLRTELPFSWRSINAVRYFGKAEKALSDGEFSDAARWYETSREAVDTPAAQLNFGIAVYNTFDLPKAASIFSAGLESARAQHDDVLESAFLTDLGNVYREQGLLDEALRQYNDAWRIAHRNGYTLAMASADFNKGVLGGMRGALLWGFSMLVGARQDYRRAGDKAGEADALVAESGDARVLAGVTFLPGVPDDSKFLLEAQANLRVAASLYERLPGVLAKANYHYALANAYDLQAYELGDQTGTDRALEEFQHAYIIYERIGYKQGRFLAMGGLGNAYQLKRNYAQAKDSWMRCLAIAREIGNPFREAVAFGRLGDLEQASGSHDGALENYEQSAHLAGRIGAYGVEAQALDGLGDVHAKAGDQKAASAYFDLATEVGKRSGDLHLQIMTAKDVTSTYSRMHDVERTREAASRLRDLYSAAGYVKQAAEVQHRIDQLPQ